MKSSAVLIAFVLLSSFIQLYGQNKKLSIAAAPSWITSVPVDYNKNKLDAEAEDGYVDLAYQKQIALATQTVYYKVATKILSESGVQNNSQVSIDFDPVYEHVTLHTLKIIRNGQSINKLDLSKFKTVQKETDLRNFMYNGTLTALIFLEDVRKDDIIEYSYSRTGFNPIYAGKYAGVFDAAFSVPVYQLFYKISVPDARSITIKNSNTNITPVVTKTQGATDYAWMLTDMAPVHVQDNLPSWYDAYANIMVSEYKSWSEVSNWATALFPFNISLSAPLKNKIEEIKNTNATPEARTLAALHFVQDEVRYMGIEMGEGSHRPSNPNKIFAQRFGDCKDKTYLLCTLLRAMDIEADPILINTGYKATIKNWLPSSRAFDHVTTRVIINNHTYFFDATIPYQRGNINTISYPDYQCGLLVKNNTTGLTNIPTNKNAFVHVKEVFNIPDMYGAAHFLVTTIYTGSNADATRSDFKTTSKSELLKTYKKYYAGYFEKIEADSLNFKDNEDGTFTTYEYYSIPYFWKLTNELKKSSFSPFVIYGLLKKPSDKSRTMPFYLDYPLHYKEEIEVNLPEVWKGKSYASTTTCANFNLSEECKMYDRKMELIYEYENLKDHVTPDEATAYFKNYTELDESVNYDLTWKEGETSFSYAAASVGDGSPISNYNILYAILGVCVLITILIKTKR